MSTTISGTNGVTFPDSTSMQTGQQACKAWVNFNGTGTVAIRDAYNVSSITDNGTGLYTVNFTNAMPDTNYIGLGSGASQTSASVGMRVVGPRNGGAGYNPYSTDSLAISSTYANASLEDCAYVSVAIFSN